GSGASRTIRVQPAANASGSSVITVSVTDGDATTSDTFTVTVNAVNDGPTIEPIANATTPEDTALDRTANIADIDTPVANLTLSPSSSDTTLLPTGGITFSGTGASRTVHLQPAADRSGSATVTITVSDGAGGQASTLFTLTVTAVNDPPAISNIPNQ